MNLRILSSHQHQKGEAALFLTLIGIAVMAIGAFTGTALLRNNSLKQNPVKAGALVTVDKTTDPVYALSVQKSGSKLAISGLFCYKDKSVSGVTTNWTVSAFADTGLTARVSEVDATNSNLSYDASLCDTAESTSSNATADQRRFVLTINEEATTQLLSSCGSIHLKYSDTRSDGTTTSDSLGEIKLSEKGLCGGSAIKAGNKAPADISETYTVISGEQKEGKKPFVGKVLYKAINSLQDVKDAVNSGSDNYLKSRLDAMGCEPVDLQRAAAKTYMAFDGGGYANPGDTVGVITCKERTAGGAMSAKGVSDAGYPLSTPPITPLAGRPAGAPDTFQVVIILECGNIASFVAWPTCEGIYVGWHYLRDGADPETWPAEFAYKLYSDSGVEPADFKRIKMQLPATGDKSSVAWGMFNWPAGEPGVGTRSIKYAAWQGTCRTPGGTPVDCLSLNPQFITTATINCPVPPSVTPTASSTPVPTVPNTTLTPTATLPVIPTVSPSLSPSVTPSSTPTNTPTMPPSLTPTLTPTATPTPCTYDSVGEIYEINEDGSTKLISDAVPTSDAYKMAFRHGKIRDGAFVSVRGDQGFAYPDGVEKTKTFGDFEQYPLTTQPTQPGVAKLHIPDLSKAYDAGVTNAYLVNNFSYMRAMFPADTYIFDHWTCEDQNGVQSCIMPTTGKQGAIIDPGGIIGGNENKITLRFACNASNVYRIYLKKCPFTSRVEIYRKDANGNDALVQEATNNSNEYYTSFTHNYLSENYPPVRDGAGAIVYPEPGIKHFGDVSGNGWPTPPAVQAGVYNLFIPNLATASDNGHTNVDLRNAFAKVSAVFPNIYELDKWTCEDTNLKAKSCQAATGTNNEVKLNFVCGANMVYKYYIKPQQCTYQSTVRVYEVKTENGQRYFQRLMTDEFTNGNSQFYTTFTHTKDGQVVRNAQGQTVPANTIKTLGNVEGDWTGLQVPTPQAGVYALRLYNLNNTTDAGVQNVNLNGAVADIQVHAPDSYQLQSYDCRGTNGSCATSAGTDNNVKLNLTCNSTNDYNFYLKKCTYDSVVKMYEVDQQGNNPRLLVNETNDSRFYTKFDHVRSGSNQPIVQGWVKHLTDGMYTLHIDDLSQVTYDGVAQSKIANIVNLLKPTVAKAIVYPQFPTDEYQLVRWECSGDDPLNCDNKSAGGPNDQVKLNFLCGSRNEYKYYFQKKPNMCTYDGYVHVMVDNGDGKYVDGGSLLQNKAQFATQHVKFDRSKSQLLDVETGNVNKYEPPIMRWFDNVINNTSLSLNNGLTYHYEGTQNTFNFPLTNGVRTLTNSSAGNLQDGVSYVRLVYPNDQYDFVKWTCQDFGYGKGCQQDTSTDPVVQLNYACNSSTNYTYYLKKKQAPMAVCSYSSKARLILQLTEGRGVFMNNVTSADANANTFKLISQVFSLSAAPLYNGRTFASSFTNGLISVSNVSLDAVSKNAIARVRLDIPTMTIGKDANGKDINVPEFVVNRLDCIDKATGISCPIPNIAAGGTNGRRYENNQIAGNKGTVTLIQACDTNNEYTYYLGLGQEFKEKLTRIEDANTGKNRSFRGVVTCDSNANTGRSDLDFVRNDIALNANSPFTSLDISLLQNNCNLRFR